MSFKSIFHLFIATLMTPNFTSPLAPQMRQVTQLLFSAIERCIQVIRNWMHDNKLLFNEAKTEFLLIGTKQQLAKVNISHVKVGNANIAPHFPVKNLGVWFDSNLSMVDHITKTSSAAFYHLYNIRRIRKYLTKECTETLIHAFISSRLDYCKSFIWSSRMPSSQITESSKCCCAIGCPGEQILSHYTFAQVTTLAACKISYCFQTFAYYFESHTWSCSTLHKRTYFC